MCVRVCARTVELWNLFFVLLLVWLALLEEKSIATDVDIFAAVCFCAAPSQPLYISSSDVPTCYKNTYLANKNTKTYSTVHVRVCVSTKQQKKLDQTIFNGNGNAYCCCCLTTTKQHQSSAR